MLNLLLSLLSGWMLKEVWLYQEYSYLPLILINVLFIVATSYFRSTPKDKEEE